MCMYDYFGHEMTGVKPPGRVGWSGAKSLVNPCPFNCAPPAGLGTMDIDARDCLA